MMVNWLESGVVPFYLQNVIERNSLNFLGSCQKECSISLFPAYFPTIYKRAVNYER